VSRPSGEEWLALTHDLLPVEEVLAWAVRPDCGAVVVFCGTVRDHAEGRADVTGLEYEAYEAQVLPRLQAIAAEVRSQWPETGRIALLHRIGALALAETSVVVVVSAPHRAEAFDAARFAIDTLKATVPIWKRESWRDGTDWGTGAQPVAEVGT
jgi:molybdopterin synthase catalytic subunit